MSKDIYQENSYRRKRVQRLKKLIVSLFMIFILIPYVCCIILFIKVNALSGQIDDFSRQVEDLNRQLEQLIQTVGPGQEASKLPPETAGEDPAQDKTAKGESSNSSEENDLQTQQEEQPAHKVYLTFDDGPSAYTDTILDILNSYGVKATFFVVGKEDEDSKAALKRIVEEGHTLGMHSYSHKYTQLYESVDAFAEDFEKIQAFLYDTVGEESVYYRFPGGSSNIVSTVDMQEFADYLKSQGVTFYDWNISSGDGSGKRLSKEELLANSTKGIERYGTSIILMHDSVEKYTTVEALPEIIENILAMEDTVILPITEDTVPVQHIHTETE